MVSDKHRSIASFAKSEGLKHVSFKSYEHTAGGEYHVQNVNNMASSLKAIVNTALRGVSTKYLENYARWYQLRSSKVSDDETKRILLKDKNISGIHINREKMYKWFIENFSRRTYRCPIKREFKSATDAFAFG